MLNQIDFESISFSQDNLLTQFGKNLKRARTAKNMSQEKLALENDFDPTYISLLERGKRNLSLKTMHKLAYFLGVEVKELLEGI